MQSDDQRDDDLQRRESRGGAGGGSFGGMGDRLNEVDLDRAEEVGSDPPGGAGLDISGSQRPLGAEQDENEASA